MKVENSSQPMDQVKETILSMFKISCGTSFHIDNYCDPVLATLPLQLTDDILVVEESVEFTRYGCGSCNNPIAVVRLSKQTELVLDPNDLKTFDENMEIAHEC